MREKAFKRHRASGAGLLLRYLLLGIVAAVMLGPLLWMLRVAFAPRVLSLDITNLFLPLFTTENFREILSSRDFYIAALNSVIVATVVVVGNCLFCFMAGYALARRRVPGSPIIFGSLLLTLMLPSHVLIIPLYLMMTQVGLFDTYGALILPFLVTPIGVFMMRQYFFAIPVSLEEAARVDGAGELRILFQVLFPLCRPALATLAIQAFLANWNSFLYPFILTNSNDLRTLPVALALLQGHQAVDWQRLMAGSTLAVAPIMIVFLIFQRQIVSGVTAGAVKQ